MFVGVVKEEVCVFDWVEFVVFVEFLGDGVDLGKLYCYLFR